MELKTYIGKNKSHLSALRARILKKQTKQQKSPSVPAAKSKGSPMKKFIRNSSNMASSSESVDFEEEPQHYPCFSKNTVSSHLTLPINAESEVESFVEQHLSAQEAVSLQEQEEQERSQIIR